MKIYAASIYDKETGHNESVKLAVIDTETEQKYYDSEKYDDLFRNSGYDDNDIFYYINKDEIPENHNGHIMKDDVYDYITVLSAKLLYQSH